MLKESCWIVGFCLLAVQAPVNIQAAGITDSDGDGVADNLDACPADQHKLGPGLTGCGTSDTDAILIGGWWSTTTAASSGETVNLSIYPNGTYLFAQYSENAPSSLNGMEYGTYEINPITSELTVAVLFDQNGEIGLSHPGGTMTLVAVDADNFSLDIVAGEALNLSRIKEAGKPEVGSWWPGSNNPTPGGLVGLTFYPNGTYTHCQNGDSTNPDWIGIEYGIYSFDPVSETITATVLYDQNNALGLSHPEGPSTFLISGRNAVMSDLSRSAELARVAPIIPDKIGAYHQGNWYLDISKNGTWEYNIDRYGSFGTNQMRPVVGDWDGDSDTEIGAFHDGVWYFDINGNGFWDGVPTDRMAPAYGIPGDFPVAGDWDGDGVAEIGVYHPSNNTWYLDYDGSFTYNPTFDVSQLFGFTGCIPVVGDWDGDGRDNIGVYYNGQWYLDLNGNFSWDGIQTDTMYASYGVPGMLPVAGDWTGKGVDQIGAYQNGDWYLDIDGNGAWNPALDKYMGSFGITGMAPMVGNYFDPSDVIRHDPAPREGSFVISAISNNTSEDGGTATFSVRLGSAPSADVTIPISSSDPSEGTVNHTSLTFTSANWDVNQTVTVTGVNDNLADGAIDYYIHLGAASSTDNLYHNLDPADVAATNSDVRFAGFDVSAISGSTSESGTEASFLVRLASQPSADVLIPISSTDLSEGSVDHTGLTFTNTNWNTYQQVTVTGVSDTQPDGPVTYTIALGTSVSSDSLYNGLDPADVMVTNDDVPPVEEGSVWLSTLSAEIDESGSSATFTVVLGAQPTAEVTVPVSSSDLTEGTVNVSAVTFTPTDWYVPQPITVTGVGDDLDDGNQTFTIVIGAASSTDRKYDGLDPTDVTVTNVDLVSTYSVTPAISAGNYHNLLLANDGSVWGWGACGSGQLDTAAACSSRFVLPQLINSHKAAAISAGYNFSAIVAQDGSVWTSGDNRFGQLGHADSTALTQVNNLSNAKMVAAGTYHLLALKTDGTVWAWGKGEAGQLGNNIKLRSTVPVQSLGDLAGKTITSVAAGQDHSLALDDSGKVYTWGADGSEQLGLGAGAQQTATPTTISALSAVSVLGAGQLQSFAVGVVGVNTDVYGWGYNVDSQLGMAGSSLSPTKAVPTGLSTFSASLLASRIDGYYMHGVALTANGAVYTWGDNENALDASHSDSWDNRGALGNNSVTDKTLPTLAFTAAGPALDVNAGANYTLVLFRDGRLQASGLNNNGQLGSNEIATSGVNMYTKTPVFVEDPGDLGAGGSIHFSAYRPILTGYPAVATSSTTASVAVCPNTLVAPADCGPITHYKYSTDNGNNWSSPTAIADPISLTDLSPGPVNLWVKGMRNASTEIQTQSSAVKVSWTVN